MAKRRRQRMIGVVPRIGRGLRWLSRWLWTHPQPFIVTGATVLLVWWLASFLKHSEAFQVTAVSVPGASMLKPQATLIGANIWELDVNRLSDELHRQQPSLKAVRVTRRLPSTIRIEPIQRIPVAQVRLDQWYPVDGEGFILPEGSAEGSAKLVRLVGLNRTANGLRAGKDNTSEALTLALRVLERVRKSPLSISRRIREINVADPREIRLVLASSDLPEDDGIEVRCGAEAELAAHLERLRAVLKVVARQQLAVRYIDVRFPEPVIGPRT